MTLCNSNFLVDEITTLDLPGGEREVVRSVIVEPALNLTADVYWDRKTGFLIPPKDPHSLARAIITLLKDIDLAARLGEAGRKRVEKKFTIDLMIERIESLFHEISK